MIANHFVKDMVGNGLKEAMISSAVAYYIKFGVLYLSTAISEICNYFCPGKTIDSIQPVNSSFE